MAIFLTGDTHIPIDVEKLNMKQFPEQKTLTRKDYLIVLGDFGLLWHKDKSYYWWKRWLEEKPFTLLWLDGNHENHEWIDSLPVSEWHRGNVHIISPNIIHLMRGQIFNLERKKFFVFGGAASYDKEQRREGIDWWSREEGSYGEQNEGLENLAVLHNKVDYILTHDCPDELVAPMFHKEAMPSPTGNYLNHIAHTIDFGHWYFGHWHMTKDFGKYTVLYNTIRKL